MELSNYIDKAIMEEKSNKRSAHTAFLSHSRLNNRTNGPIQLRTRLGIEFGG